MTFSELFDLEWALETIFWEETFLLMSENRVNPHTSVAQKVADEVVFRCFQGVGVKFFLNRIILTPSDFWYVFVGKYQFKPFQLSFLVDFYIKITFLVRWFYSLFERMRLKRKNDVNSHLHAFNHIVLYKRYLFFPDLAMSQCWSAIFCATGVWGYRRW